jgi:hypothetical protein
MQISVRYRRGLMETYRLRLHFSRISWLHVALGVLAIIAGLAVWPGYAPEYCALGAYAILLGLFWDLGYVYRYRQSYRQETEVTLSSEGIEWRVGGSALQLTWELVERADEVKGHWVFSTGRPIRRIFLRQRELSQEQQAELAAFLQARHIKKQPR